MTLAYYKKLANELLSTSWVIKEGVAINIKSRGWRFKWIGRKTALGLCRLKQKEICLSRSLVEINLDKEAIIDDTIRHEIAHALDYLTRGTSDHGYKWKRMCKVTGALPQAGIPPGSLNSPSGKYVLQCKNCGYTAHFYREVKRHKSCGHCCPSSFNENYLMEEV